MVVAEGAGRRVAQRRCVRRDLVAVVAVVLQRIGTEFRWSNSTTAVVPQAA
jgi:hypothetical protein